MKKNIALVVFLVGALLVSGCGVLTSKSGFTDDYIQSCYDLGGLMSKDGCVLCGGSNCGNKNSPAENTDISCEVELARMGAPDGTIEAICSGSYGTVSERLTSGTYVQIGSLTFDAEDTVWFLMDWKVPSTANYSFSYENAEKNFFDAPFVVGSELGYAKDGTRVPFKICWEVESENCKLPKGVKIH